MRMSTNLQDLIMKYDPQTGTESMVYPSHSVQYRKYHDGCAWLYNPWTGQRRDTRDIGSDVFGILISMWE